MQRLIIITIILGLTYSLNNYAKDIYLGKPTHAKGLNKDSIDSIAKSKVTKKWIRDQFNIEDRYLKKYKKTAKQVITIIYTNIKVHPGLCACPYNKKSNGHRCGGNSAYSDPRREPILCYPVDVLK